MKRDFSFRVFLNRSERNTAQEKAEKLGIKGMPELFRLALDKLDTDLADEILKLKADLNTKSLQVDDLQEKLKVAESVAVMHEKNAAEWSTSYLATQSELREKIAEYEQMSAESAEYERKWQEQSKRADTFEQTVTEKNKEIDKAHNNAQYLNALLNAVAEAAGTPGAKRESIAPLVAEHRAIRSKYRDAYYFLLHEFDIVNRDEGYDTKHFHNALESLFSIIEDDAPYKENDAHLRFGLRIPNVVARYKNARRTERDYFLLLCHRLDLDIEKPHSLCDFERAFDKRADNSYLVERFEKIEAEYEDIRTIFREVYHQLYYVSVFSIMWDRFKRFFSRNSVRSADMVMYEKLGSDPPPESSESPGQE